MSNSPLLSYIVLSYNYERYIGKTLQSIIDQTVEDFEIVVVDDASVDTSVAIVSAIDDPRIRLFVNEKNLGGAASYNRAVQEARGQWLVNLDADDWVDPRKAEIQLEEIARNPQLDVIGTYVAIYDENDNRHSSADAMEAAYNQPRDLNLVDTWIGANHLCRSSTMVRASAHKRIGLDDPLMVRAPDYELWTRALHQGCKFTIIPQRLTSIRAHSRGVTHGDPVGTLLEVSYAMQRNLVPLAEARSLLPSITRMVDWICRHPALSHLPPLQAHRLVGLMMRSIDISDFQNFRAMLGNYSDYPELAEIGRRCFSFVGPSSDAYQDVDKLYSDIRGYIEAREHFKDQSERWERAYQALYAEYQAANSSPKSAKPSSNRENTLFRLFRKIIK